METIDAKDNLISQIEPLVTCPTLCHFDISFNQLQTILPLLTALAYIPCRTLQLLKFNDNPFLANRYNTVEPYLARIFPNLKEINNLYLNQLKLENSPQREIENFGDLAMVENPQEVITTRQKYIEIMNLIMYHQSEKSYVNKRINSKILIGKWPIFENILFTKLYFYSNFIDYLYTTKYAMMKYEMLPIES